MIEKVTGGFGFQYELRETFAQVFEGLTSPQIDQKLRDSKVLRKNQGCVVKGELYVTGRTCDSVQACYERLDQYLTEELEDLRATRPVVSFLPTKGVGPCDFCSVGSRMVWVFKGKNTISRMCDDCLQSAVKQMQETRDAP